MYKFLIAFIACCLAFNASAATSEILQKSQTSWNNTPIKQMNLTEPEVTVTSTSYFECRLFNQG